MSILGFCVDGWALRLWWTTTLRQFYDRSLFRLAYFGEGIEIVNLEEFTWEHCSSEVTISLIKNGCKTILMDS